MSDKAVPIQKRVARNAAHAVGRGQQRLFVINVRKRQPVARDKSAGVGLRSVKLRHANNINASI